MGRSPQTIYIVDDDEGVRESLAFLLESHGLTTRTFSSGEDVLTHAGELGTGCLVLDYHMPRRNGLEVLGTLRSKGIGLPAVLITGGGSGEIERLAAGAGVVAYLEKPIADDQLLGAIDRALDGPAAGSSRQGGQPGDAP